jgi:hypothetical protein
MAIYRSELSAIVCAVNAGMTPIMTVQSWQGQYKSGFVEDLTKKHSDTEKLNAIDKLAQDSITRARIKRNAKRGGYFALVAKYGADEQDRANAVNELVKICEISTTDEGKRLLIWLWAVEGKQRRGIIEQVMDFFNQVSRSTFFRRKKEVFIWLDDLESLVISEAKEVLRSML